MKKKHQRIKKKKKTIESINNTENQNVESINNIEVKPNQTCSGKEIVQDCSIMML